MGEALLLVTAHSRVDQKRKERGNSHIIEYRGEGNVTLIAPAGRKRYVGIQFPLPASVRRRDIPAQGAKLSTGNTQLVES
jgi:hypothetical protein